MNGTVNRKTQHWWEKSRDSTVVHKPTENIPKVYALHKKRNQKLIFASIHPKSCVGFFFKLLEIANIFFTHCNLNSSFNVWWLKNGKMKTVRRILSTGLSCVTFFPGVSSLSPLVVDIWGFLSITSHTPMSCLPSNSRKLQWGMRR